jgi:hypothetical protein
VTEGAVVNEVIDSVVDSGGMQYAVIAGLRTETGLERFVIAYPNEESLRDLIAAPSIIAAGFSSREEAAADSRASVAPEVGRQERLEEIATRETERRRREPRFAQLRGDRGSVFQKLARFIVTSYGDIAATVIIIFASKSAISSVLRMALGSSV